MSEDKILRLSEISRRNDLAVDLSHAVLCYGSFNIIHPGHLRYLNQAKSRAEELVVAVNATPSSLDTSAMVFSGEDRAAAVAALSLVSKVILLDSGALIDLVRLSFPKALVLGTEFQEHRKSEIANAVTFLENNNAKIFYDAGVVSYASSELLHRDQLDIEIKKKEAFQKILETYQIDLEHILQKIVDKKPRLLVIGDTIVDQYIACDALGMSAEAPVIVVKEFDKVDYLGGAGVVASHLQSLGADCTYISVVGRDSYGAWVRDE